MIAWLSVFLFTFFFMEFMAWFLHKYVMHGPLWILHKDHHVKIPGRSYQLNDAFAIFFAIPSFFSILFDSMYHIPLLGAIGFGIMAYGIAYFYVHEVVIHRRWKIFNVPDYKYIKAIREAHRIHHSINTKEGCSNFGMLVVAKRS